MTLTPEQKQALQALRGLTPRERIEALHEQDREDAHEAEREKVHPFSNFRLPAEEWEALKLHIMDGGGVSDGHHTMRLLLNALFNDDQAVFWSELPHHIKATGKHLGVIVRHPTGHVSFNGVGPTMPTPKE